MEGGAVCRRGDPGGCPLYPQHAALLSIQCDPAAEGRCQQRFSIEPVYRVDTSRREYYNTQFELLKSRRVAEKVVTHLGLAELPEFNGQPNPDSWLSRIKGLCSAGHQEDASSRHQHALEYLARHLTVSPVRDTQLVSIGFESRSPELAASVANEVAQTYINLNVEERVDANTTASHWNQSRLVEIKASLEKQEKQLGDFLPAMIC